MLTKRAHVLKTPTCAALVTIGDKTITYLTFTPDELLLIEFHVFLVHAREGISIELLSKNYLT